MASSKISKPAPPAWIWCLCSWKTHPLPKPSSSLSRSSMTKSRYVHWNSDIDPVEDHQPRSVETNPGVRCGNDHQACSAERRRKHQSPRSKGKRSSCLSRSSSFITRLWSKPGPAHGAASSVTSSRPLSRIPKSARMCSTFWKSSLRRYSTTPSKLCPLTKSPSSRPRWMLLSKTYSTCVWAN